MYLQYWKLSEKPFNNTPDPRFFYSAHRHEDALMKLSYVITENAGAGLLSGPFGSGKTAIAHALMRNLGDGYTFSYISYPALSPVELLRSIVRNFLPEEPLPQKKNELLLDALLEKLGALASAASSPGSGCAAIIDEAHLIRDPEALEAIMLLLNFQTEKNFLVPVILIGQPELEETVSGMEQLCQRVAVRCAIGALSEDETALYIKSRLESAGAGNGIFTPDAIRKIYESSSGIPRKINRVCELALFSGFAGKKDNIDGEFVMKTVREFGLGE